MSEAPDLLNGNQSDENITLSQNQLDTLNENLVADDHSKDPHKKSKSKNNSMLRRSKNSSNFKKASDSQKKSKKQFQKQESKREVNSDLINLQSFNKPKNQENLNIQSSNKNDSNQDGRQILQNEALASRIQYGERNVEGSQQEDPTTTNQTVVEQLQGSTQSNFMTKTGNGGFNITGPSQFAQPQKINVKEVHIKRQSQQKNRNPNMDTIQPIQKNSPFSPQMIQTPDHMRGNTIDHLNKVSQKLRPKFKWMNELDPKMDPKKTEFYLQQSYTPQAQPYRQKNRIELPQMNSIADSNEYNLPFPNAKTKKMLQFGKNLNDLNPLKGQQKLSNNDSSSGYDFNFVKSRQQVISNLKSMPENDLSVILQQKQNKNIILYDNTNSSQDPEASLQHALTIGDNSGLSQKLKMGLDLSNVNANLYGSINQSSYQASAARYPKSTNKGVQEFLETSDLEQFLGKLDAMPIQSQLRILREKVCTQNERLLSIDDQFNQFQMTKQELQEFFQVLKLQLLDGEFDSKTQLQEFNQMVRKKISKFNKMFDFFEMSMHDIFNSGGRQYFDTKSNLNSINGENDKIIRLIADCNNLQRENGKLKEKNKLLKLQSKSSTYKTRKTQISQISPRDAAKQNFPTLLEGTGSMDSQSARYGAIIKSTRNSNNITMNYNTEESIQVDQMSLQDLSKQEQAPISQRHHQGARIISHGDTPNKSVAPGQIDQFLLFQNNQPSTTNKVTYNNSPSKNNLVSTFSPPQSVSPKQTPRADSRQSKKPTVNSKVKQAEIRKHMKDYIAQQSIQLSQKMISLMSENPIKKVIPGEDNQKQDESALQLQQKLEAQQNAHNLKQFTTIRESLQTEIERVCMVEKCIVMKVVYQFGHNEETETQVTEPGASPLASPTRVKGVKNKQDKAYLSDGSDFKFEVQKQTILADVVKSKKPTCIHEHTKERINITAKLNKIFGLRINNAMFMPISVPKMDARKRPPQGNRATDDLFIICMFNHESDDEFESIKLGGSHEQRPIVMSESATRQKDFDPRNTPITSQLFIQTFQHTQSFINQIITVLNESGMETQVINLIEKIMSSFSVKTFAEAVEKECPRIFNCERVNVVLIDRFKQDLYRYVHQENNPSKLVTKSFSMEQGLAGYVAISCHTIFTDKISEENRYIPEIDDLGSLKEGVQPARQLITCPIFAKTDKEEVLITSADGTQSLQMSQLGKFPRAIIQLINKNEYDGFDPEDVEKIEFLSQTLGRCHDIITKVEQLNCMRSVSVGLMNCTIEVTNQMDDNLSNYTRINQTISDFISKQDDPQNQIKQ